MVSPYLLAAAARANYRAPLAIENQTYFTLFARWPREIRLMSIEWEKIHTEAEALEAVKQLDHVVQVWRNDPDVARCDVSEDVARTYLDQWIERGGNPEEDDVPEFIGEHLTTDEIMQVWNAGYAAGAGGLK
jgi:hypothetical protein